MTFTLDLPPTLEGTFREGTLPEIEQAVENTVELLVEYEEVTNDEQTLIEKIAEFERLLSSVSEADQEYRSAKEEFEVIESQYKRCQSRLADAKADRQFILDQLPKEIARVRSGDLPSQAASQPGDESETTQDTDDPNSRMNVSTRDVLNGVKGLGAKKLDAICDEFPTLGKLEEARGEASKAHKHFSEILPRGVGKGIADDIENQMLQFM